MTSQDPTAPVWTPGPEQLERSQMAELLREVRDELRTDAYDEYAALWEWSVANAGRFWRMVAERSGLIFEEVPPGDAASRSAPTPDPRSWFTPPRDASPASVPGRDVPDSPFPIPISLNFAENLLRHRDDRQAIVFWDERGRQRTLSFAALHAEVARVAGALHAMGVRPGDRVAGWLPNLPETVVAMLAATWLGAVWSSCSPDFGTRGVVDRFGQIEPRVLLAADGYRYAGKAIDCLPRLREILAGLPTVERTIVVPQLRDDPPLAGIREAVRWDALPPGAPPPFVHGPFGHPVYIMYSSGTTGLPKCMVHGAGGTLLQHAKELMLHVDLRRDDRIFYFTTCGWMMWNWLVSSLFVGATVVLYDGAPLAPEPDVLWRMAAAEDVTVFGTSAKYLALCEKAGLDPARTHDLAALRTILSTGSPLAAHSYDYVARDVKPGVQLASISGGTDLLSCFALGTPLRPVYRGELQCRGLGMAVDVFDEEGHPVVGTPGELVCTRPFPSMPVAFWNDPDGARYHAAYFEHFPGVWRHGDWAERTAHDGVIIYGRSDATLNPGGVRIGTAEIYRQVEQLPEIVESLVIGQERDEDVRIVLFVRLREGAALDEPLRESIRRRIRAHTSPHHVPRIILQVADIPRTISGKITELAVRDVIHGREVKNVHALANPEALELYRDIPELRD